MKIDLSMDLASLDVTAWDLQVWVAVLLLSQAFAITMLVWHEVRKQRSPVDRLMRDDGFGV